MWVNNSFAQTFSTEEQNQLDSLYTIINNPNSHDTSLAGSYVGLSELLHIAYPDSNIYVCNKAKEIAENALFSNPPNNTVKQSLLRSLANAISNLGMIYDENGDTPKAIEYFYKSLKIQE